MRKLTLEEFIKRSNKIHKGKYDYSDVEYENSTKKVIIYCPKHGKFEQVVHTHLSGGGCRKCQYELPSRKRNTKRKDFIHKSKGIHGNKYDYSNVEYINSDTKVKIKCFKHGIFYQTPTSHLAGRKCRKCGYEERNQSDSKNDFIRKAIKIHGNLYDYKNVDYKRSQIKVKVICPVHGEFKLTPNKHLLGQGCRACGYEKMRGVPETLYDEFKRIKRAVSSVYHRGTYTKNSIVYKVIGCDWETFKAHLENNEFGFKVGQKEIDLDHIVPISKANTKEELYKLNHYTNFQLLPSFYNRNIKRKNEFDINHFREWFKDNNK